MVLSKKQDTGAVFAFKHHVYGEVVKEVKGNEKNWFGWNRNKEQVLEFVSQRQERLGSSSI